MSGPIEITLKCLGHQPQFPADDEPLRGPRLDDPDLTLEGVAHLGERWLYQYRCTMCRALVRVEVEVIP